jgi:hypothetical protein
MHITSSGTVQPRLVPNPKQAVRLTFRAFETSQLAIASVGRWFYDESGGKDSDITKPT